MKRIIHVAEVALTEETGMGRIACHWKRAFEKRGYEFIHFGPEDVGAVPHKALFGRAAFKSSQSLLKETSICLVHEPASASFARGFVPTVVFSHGIERRGWDITLASQSPGESIKLKSRLLFPLWRIRPSETGLRKARGLLVSNEEDKLFARMQYGRRSEDIVIFRNGVYPMLDKRQRSLPPTILFMGTWISRKGWRQMVEAATRLFDRGLAPRWLLAGTGISDDLVLNSWPKRLRPFVEIVTRFRREEEQALLSRAGIFILPSLFEGQPLALLQAMEAGCCCIASDCCGQTDLIEHGKTGLLFDVGDVDSLVNLLCNVLSDDGLRESLGCAAHESVSARKWDAVADEVVDSVEKFCAS